MFLLSVEDVKTDAYFPGSRTSSAFGSGKVSLLASNTTDYVKWITGTEGIHYWLRTPGSQYETGKVYESFFHYDSAAEILFGDGTVFDSGMEVDLVSRGHTYAGGVRLAFNLDTSNILFTSAAVDGKTTGNLSSVADYTGNEWKLTLLNSNRSSFTVDAGEAETSIEVGYSSWSIPVTYSGAQTGSNEYVSVLLCDSNDTVLYYGKLAQNSVNGEATLNIPSGLPAGNYTLKVFSEQCNGDYKTDYASGTLSNVEPGMEYSTDGGASWTEITGTTVTGLAAGTYGVRVKANGTKLASPAATVTISEYVAPSIPSGGGTVISKPTTSRVAGDDRFETAVEVADQLKKELGVTRFNAIVVAYSDEFADALSASAFAHENEAPVLVVNENNEEYVKRYIEQNLVKGGKVYIIGGNAVVTDRFEDSLSESNVSRLGGDDRYETNLLTLKQLNLGGKDTIIIASGLDYADALSASSTGLPVMIVGDKLTDSQSAYLKTLGGNDTYYIAGGTAAVSSEVEKQLKSLNLGTVNRLAGDDRYETSVLIAETFYEKSTLAYLASGDDFPDGLTGGVLAGLSRDGKGAPLLLVNEHNTNLAASYIEDAGVRTVKAIGGTAAISDETLKAVI